MKSVKGFESQAVRVFLALFFLLGCARVNLTAKEPIKLDVTMRLDIYQHVAQDADEIENMISAPAAEKRAASDKTSWLMFGVQEVYAQEDGSYPADVQAAIDARKDRRQILLAWESKGVIGENAAGFAEVRDPAAADSSVFSYVSAENADRQIIYEYVARKNGTESSETGKVFAKRIQVDVPGGTPIQSSDGNWIIK